MLRVASYNIENLDFSKPDWTPTLEDRIPVLRASLNRLKADIICFQEVHGQELDDHTEDHDSRDLLALKKVLEDTPYANYEIASTLTQSGVVRDKRNLVIASKFPILKSDQHWNDFCPAPAYQKATEILDDDQESEAKDIKWERPIQYAKIDLGPPGPLHVINLHLKSKIPSSVKGQMVPIPNTRFHYWKTASAWAEGYFVSSMKRVGQALEVRMLLDKIFDQEPEAKIVVCGDFNAEPGQVPVEAILGRVENTGNPALQPTVLVPCSRSIPESIRYSHLHHGHGNLLDHILISQSMMHHFESAQLFNETLHDESMPGAWDNKFPESDHAPFLAIFDA